MGRCQASIRVPKIATPSADGGISITTGPSSTFQKKLIMGVVLLGVAVWNFRSILGINYYIEQFQLFWKQNDLLQKRR